MPAADTFWGGLADEDAAALRAAGHERAVSAGQIVLHDGDDPVEVLVLLQGSVRVSRTSVDGREVVVGVRLEGDVLGEVAALDGQGRSAAVSTLTEVRLLILGRQAFGRLVRERPGINRAVIAMLCERLREATDQVLELGTDDALARVCRRLAEQAERASEPTPAGPSIVLAASQQELAARSGLSREAVVKALRALRTLGWITQEGRQVVLVDQAAVLDRAGLR